MSGYFKHFRKLRHHPNRAKPAWYSVFLNLLERAQWHDSVVCFDGAERTLKPGQCIVSSSAISRETGVPNSTVKRLLNGMQMAREVDQEIGRTSRLITITSWAEYQADGPRDGPQMVRKWSANGPIQEERRKKKEVRTRKMEDTNTIPQYVFKVAQLPQFADIDVIGEYDKALNFYIEHCRTLREDGLIKWLDREVAASAARSARESTGLTPPVEATNAADFAYEPGQIYDPPVSDPPGPPKKTYLTARLN